MGAPRHLSQRTPPLLLSFLLRPRSTSASYFIMLTSKYIGLSTQSVGVGPGMYNVPHQLLYPEPNRLSLVARFETSRVDLHACVSLRLVRPIILVDPDFSSLRYDHT